MLAELEGITQPVRGGAADVVVALTASKGMELMIWYNLGRHTSTSRRPSLDVRPCPDPQVRVALE